MSRHLVTNRPEPHFAAKVTPYLAVAGAREALSWYAEAFGARVIGDPIVTADGRVGHAEIEIGGAQMMLSEEQPEVGVSSPSRAGGNSVTIHLEVPDVDSMIAGALSAGAVLERAAENYEYGRNGVMRDPFGHRWMISGPNTVAGPRHGDVGYVSLWVRDLDRATRFFSTVLGWGFREGSSSQGRQVEGAGVHHGLWGGQEAASLFCCFAVEDIAMATEQVRLAGGTAQDPHLEPYGLISECTDDQGTDFAVYQPPAGVSGPAGGPDPVPTHGNLVYVVMEVQDGERARDFYRFVLDWQLVPGRSDARWQAQGLSPLVGISGGHLSATNVPMYKVDEISEAVARVRRSGGTATEPEAQPHGIISGCTDDQGTRFYLGQL
jgi:predicted enzyme related to lactoylglutathione lyase